MSKRKAKKKTINIAINKIIIETTAVIVSIFALIGVSMSQLFDPSGQRFYELIGWAFSLTFPFVIATIFSIIVVAYKDGDEIPQKWVYLLKQASVFTYTFSWIWLVITSFRWSPEYYSSTLKFIYGTFMTVVVTFFAIVGVVSLVYKIVHIARKLIAKRRGKNLIVHKS